ncbi:MAG: hypothetical protein RAO92_09090 [Candidatus Euphemobacter frigidus]|nr:hypothetical protein [Candidatus Euphemobacter frigidus]MDP8276542.1 hypothetical protein [Candidatus Euphemobacter frigidus]
MEFKTGRKSALLSHRFKRTRARRIIIITIILLVTLPALLYLLKHYLERSWEFTDGELKSEVVAFDAQFAYMKARALLEEGKAHEFKGRRQIVTERFREALDLLDLIMEKAPNYKSDLIARDRQFILNKLRKAK